MFRWTLFSFSLTCHPWTQQQCSTVAPPTFTHNRDYFCIWEKVIRMCRQRNDGTYLYGSTILSFTFIFRETPSWRHLLFVFYVLRSISTSWLQLQSLEYCVSRFLGGIRSLWWPGCLRYKTPSAPSGHSSINQSSQNFYLRPKSYIYGLVSLFVTIWAVSICAVDQRLHCYLLSCYNVLVQELLA